MNDDILIQRFLDHALNPDELAAFNQRLRDDADLREHLREIAGQAVAMGDFARSEADIPARRQPPESARISWLAIAASIVVLAASAWLWMGRRDAAVLTLVDSSGSITWSHGGEMREGVANGETLSAGTVETIGETAMALLRFADGTLISLTGESDLSFSEDGQKQLVLRKGSLSAQVKPQPKGRPMLVRTPTAEATVLGTTFVLSTRPDDTLLKVDEGVVKLTRLADGSAVDVPAKSSAVASLDSALKLDSASTPAPLTAWSFDFTDTVPPRDWRGIWNDTPEGGRMVASPYVASRKSADSMITHFGVSVRTAMLNPPLSLIATDRTVIRYRLRQDRPMPLQVMLLTSKTKAGYAGNFECKVPADRLHPDTQGWCELAIPIEEFLPVDRRQSTREKYPSPVGNVLTSVLISSFQTDTRLTVSHFAVQSEP